MELLAKAKAKPEEQNTQLLKYFRVDAGESLADKEPTQTVFPGRARCIDQNRAYMASCIIALLNFSRCQAMSFVNYDQGIKALVISIEIFGNPSESIEQPFDD